MIEIAENEIRQFYEAVFGSYPFKESPNREHMQDALAVLRDIPNCPPLHTLLTYQKDLMCTHCKKPIRITKIYRCYDCKMPMHRSCCMEHCGEKDRDVIMRASLED